MNQHFDFVSPPSFARRSPLAARVGPSEQQNLLQVERPRTDAPPAHPSQGLSTQLGGPALAALARQGHAAAWALLKQRCEAGPASARADAIRLLPGLVPYQPVAALLSSLGQRHAPRPVCLALAEARQLAPPAHEREPAYRAAQRALVDQYLLHCGERLQRQRQRPGQAPTLAMRERLMAIAVVCAGLYDYRFTWSDGSVYGLAARHVEEFLLDYAPRGLLLPPSERAEVPRLVAAHLTWLGRPEGGSLLPADARRLAILALALRRRYAEVIAETTPGGDDLLAAATRAGLALADLDALAAPDVNRSPEGALLPIASDADRGGALRTIHGLDLTDEFAPVWAFRWADSGR